MIYCITFQTENLGCYILIIETKYYSHAPRGIDWQEKTIARPRPPLIRMTIKEHLMFQICHTTFTIRACYGTHKPQHKYFSNSQLLTSMTLMSPSLDLKTNARNQTSHIFNALLYESFYHIPLGCLSYYDEINNLSKLPC